MINFNAISRRSTPIMKRREAREKALQALFQLENTEVTVDEAVTHIIESDKRNEFFERLVYETTEHQQEIDEKIDEINKTRELLQYKIDTYDEHIALFEAGKLSDDQVEELWKMKHFKNNET